MAEGFVCNGYYWVWIKRELVFLMRNHVHPWETCSADLNMDLRKHYVPNTFTDNLAYWTSKAMRFPMDIFFRMHKID